jgi:hypothetical protein
LSDVKAQASGAVGAEANRSAASGQANEHHAAKRDYAKTDH